MYNASLYSIIQVKDNVLQRCTAARAAVLHVAVETESGDEGIVYVKCASNEDAGKAFGFFHGQWFRGNLITAKYLREERYHERFPDSRTPCIPMRPWMASAN